MRKEMKRYLIPAFVVALGFTVTTLAVADDPEYPNGLPFKAIEQDFDTVIDAIGDLQSDVDSIQSDIDSIQSDLDSIQSDVDSIQSDVDSIQSDLGDLINVMEVEVVINLTACANLPAQCSNFGFVNPAPGNDSPIQLVASVSRSGVPVTGFVFEDFTYNSGPVAPGGATVLFCTDAHQGDTTCDGNFFFESNGGTYNMWLRPFNFQDWDDGLYAGTLSVSDADGNGVALVSFKIN